MGHDEEPPHDPLYRDRFSEQIGQKEQRKLIARRDERSVWFGLGMFGLVGWSIAIPTLLGIACGIWIDRTWPSRFSCTLMCLFGGLLIGCAIAWYWIKRESLVDSDAAGNEPPHDSEPQNQRSPE